MAAQRVRHLPPLAYDHSEIIKTAIERVKIKLEYTNVVYSLLPQQFTLGDLQSVYEIIINRKLDKRNFRKKVLGFSLLVPMKETQMTGRHRPAQLFKFNAGKYEKLKKKGINFEL